MKIEILLGKGKGAEGSRCRVAIGATPTLIWEISCRLNDGDESATASMSIHARGTEVIWRDICVPCCENGVLTGGCKKMDGACSICI